MKKIILSALAFIWALLIAMLLYFIELPTITTFLLTIIGILNLSTCIFMLVGSKFKVTRNYFQLIDDGSLKGFTAQSYWSIVWRQFKKNNLAVFGLIMVCMLLLTAIIAPVLAHNKAFLRQDYDFSDYTEQEVSTYFYQNYDFKQKIQQSEIKELQKDAVKIKVWMSESMHSLNIESVKNLSSRIWSPWYESLFDRTTFDEQVDTFFNSYLLILMLFILFIPILLILRTTFLRKMKKFKRRLSMVYIILGIGMFLIIMVFERDFIRNPAEFYTDQAIKINQVDGQKLQKFYNKNSNVSDFLQEEVSRIVVMPLLPYAAMQGNVEVSMQKPDRNHILGTTATGRDVLTVMMFGLRVSLTIGVIAVSIYCIIGIIVGAFAGFFGGWVDILLSRFIEVMICFPAMYLLLTLAVLVKEANIYWIMLIIGVTRWTGPARLIRGEYLKQRTFDYVTAATALGLNSVRIMFRHVLPNAMTPLLVTATFGIAAAILTESSLSFLGFGPSNFETWGALLKLGSSKEEIHLIIPAGTAIFLTVLFFNFIGEGLRDALDPKLRQ
ncbi:MAG: ABC transporter permease [Planctomycetes bacterium]|nr:ABC transporter permease [Planctomycetota bacterium]